MAKLLGSSISGDLNAKHGVEAAKFFKRKIKGAGVSEKSSQWLKTRPFAKAGGDNS